MEDGRLWQRRYFDHVIRDADDFARHLDYLHFNPVKHGLVRRAADWRWSSFGAWAARGVYDVDWGNGAPEDFCVGECRGFRSGKRRCIWLRGGRARGPDIRGGARQTSVIWVGGARGGWPRTRVGVGASAAGRAE